MATPRKPAKPARRTYLPEGTLSPNTPSGLPAAKKPTGMSIAAGSANAAPGGGPARKGRGPVAQGDGGLAALGGSQGLTQPDRNALVNGRANGTFLPGAAASTPRSTPRSSTRRRGR